MNIKIQIVAFKKYIEDIIITAENKDSGTPNNELKIMEDKITSNAELNDQENHIKMYFQEGAPVLFW